MKKPWEPDPDLVDELSDMLGLHNAELANMLICRVRALLLDGMKGIEVLRRLNPPHAFGARCTSCDRRMPGVH